MKPALSVIIPTYNEEKRLPNLLRCLKQQTFKDFEVIVADNKSTDRTRAIAKKFGARVCLGGLPGLGRNAGASIARAERLVFIDADTIVDADFLKSSMNYLQQQNIDVAGTLLAPESRKIIDYCALGFYNLYMRIFQYFNPHAVGSCIFSTKTIHKKIRGFDERIVLNEDSDYVKRASKTNKFRLIPLKVIISTRRFDDEGRLRLLRKYISSEFYRLFKGEAFRNEFKYEFGKHKEQLR